MRVAAALLLLLLLPGLLVPAGMLLHVCRCEPARRSTERSCCRADQPERAACCHRHDPAPADAPTPDGERLEPRCGCTWLPLPVQRFESTTPELPSALPASAIQPGGEIDQIAWSTPTTGYHWPTADGRPPPPHRERSLPLRL
jgi:hypothetical protein